MMNLLLLFLTLSSLAISLSAPTPPQWPKQFTTGIDDIRTHPPDVFTGKLYYDETLQFTRWNAYHGEDHFRTEINDFNKKISYRVERDGVGKIECSTHPITTSFPTYDFSDFIFTGADHIRGTTVDSWSHVTANVTYEYFDKQANQDPVIFIERDHADHSMAETHFYEFERGAPNPSVFNITAAYTIPCQKGFNGFLEGERISKENVLSLVNDAFDVSLLPVSTCEKAAADAKAKATCGCPYVWGGNSCGCDGHGGYDCSGLVKYAYDKAGWTGIARVSSAQCSQGVECTTCRPDATSSCVIGNVFCYDFPESGPVGAVDHIVMYIGGGKAAECPHTGLDCRVITPYMEHFVRCRRYCS